MTPPRPVAFCCEHKNFGCRGRRPRRPGRADMESAPTTARRTSFHCHRRGGFYIRPRSLPLPPREGANPLPTNQGKQPPKSKRSTTYTCGASRTPPPTNQHKRLAQLYYNPTPNSLQACPPYAHRIQNMHFVHGWRTEYTQIYTILVYTCIFAFQKGYKNSIPIASAGVYGV